MSDPQNVNDLSNSHFTAAIVAYAVYQQEADSGTVASQHLPEIAQQHFAISDVLDKMLEAHEKAG